MKPITQAWSLLLSGYLLLTASTYASEIKPYKASYTAKYNWLLPFSGTATRELSQSKDGTWIISHKVTSSVIKLEESSHFQLEDSHIIPLRYQYLQTGLGKKRTTLIEFDWDNAKITGSSSKKGSFGYDLPLATLDKLTYQLQLRRELMAGNRPGTYRVADKRRLKEYAFELLGEELLDTKLGKLNTLKFKRVRDQKTKRKTLIWLAKDWDYMLVQLHQTEKNKLYQIKVTKASLEGEPITGIVP